MSYADQVFIKNCQDILNNGSWDKGSPVRPRWEDGEPAYTIKRFALTNRYDLGQEFPIMTLRKINFNAALDEIFWIWQKKSSNVRDLSSHIWDAWADENGSIGKAYGYQLGIKHDFPEGKMDQVDWLLHTLKTQPLSRRMVSNIFVHADLNQMQLYPCAYSLTLNVSDNKLNAILNQRSQDMLVANNWNVIQYAALVMIFAQVVGFEPGELVHVIADAHIYDRHIPYIEQLLEREPYPAPKLIMDKSIGDFYAFKQSNLCLDHYRYHPSLGRIPVAV